MNRNEYLRTIRKQIHFIFDRDSIEDELWQHLDDSMQDLMDDGFSREEAEIQAVTQMGDPIEVGKQLNKEHHPILGYAWVASKIILILLAIPTLLEIAGTGYNAIQLATPAVMENSIETFPIDITLELPTHRLNIDNICLNEEGNYYLTYRSWIKYDYSRAGWHTDLFHLETSNEVPLYEGSFSGYAFLGTYGCKEFTWPEDDLLYIVCKNGKKTEINLKEYCDEKK